MKRMLSLILTAVFLSGLSIPCGATGTGTTTSRDHPDFPDAAEESLFRPAVRRCCEAGLLDPAAEDALGEPIPKADMVRLLARLYSLRLGGDGSIPPLPESLGDYIRFYDADGALVHDLFSARCVDFYAYEPQEQLVTFWSENLPQERLTLKVGFPEDGPGLTAQGVRLGYDPEDDCTRYRFLLPEGTSAQTLNLDQYQKDAMGWRSTWEVNREYGLEDPTPYDAVLYLLYRVPEQLPLCFRTFSLDSLVYDSVWRMELAVPLAALCEDLPEVRELDSIPDLPDNYRFHDSETAAVLSLYRRGVFLGYDEEGTFAGADWLTRGQAALVGARFLDAIQAETQSES